MSSLLYKNEAESIDDIFSYMCSLAVQKCAKKSEKKKASCGGAAMRKRLLIKNFVAQLLDQERQISKTGRDQLTREVNIPGKRSIHNKQIQTRINEDDMDQQEFDEDFQNDQKSYKISNSDDEEGAEEETEEGLSDDESEDQVDSTPAQNTTLDSHRQDFPAHNQYLEREDSREDSNVDVEVESSDDALTPNGYELFAGPKTSIPTETNCHKSVAPPSWHESEPDLYMLERSAPSLYYDDYANSQPGVQTADFGLTYQHDDFPVPNSCAQNDMYHLCNGQNYMISSANNNNNTSSLSTTPHLALHEGAVCHPQQNSPPQQLPENFMDEPIVSSDLSSPIVSAPATTYAELHTTTNSTLTVSSQQSILTSSLSSNSQQLTFAAGHCDYASNDLLDSTVDVEDLCNVEEKARVVEEASSDSEEEEASDDEDEQENVSSPFVDLININPSPVKQLMASDCRTEALHEATACFGSRHITDLDTQLTLIEEDEFSDSSLHPHHHLIMADYDPLMLQADLVSNDPTFPNTNFSNLPVSGSHHCHQDSAVGRSPRKRLNPLDYGLTLMALSPKRIKL